ncbi:response regulator transcription factor [Wukongibacter baidiensis]|uniref:response regulator transcription factor n=1 Tax=Wukongibacter baidiensis TaxID=1723361 RepID=UPI003D7FDA63
MNKNILLVEDDNQIRKIMRDYFKANEFKVYEARDGMEAVDVFDLYEINLIVLDIMLPKMDGWSVCNRIREKSNVPIIMLTARSDEEDQLMGFNLGADEYVTKPFSYKVLVARAKALLSRVDNKDSSGEDVISVRGIEIDQLAHNVKIYDKYIDLSPKEYSLLLYLIKNKGIVLERDKILDHVWGYDYVGDSRAVDTYIKKLRKKLMDKAQYIKTMTGVGYKFEVEK